MATMEESCHSDPNFAVICSFIEKFGELCGIQISISDLESMLEDTKHVNDTLRELHIQLLRKLRKCYNKDKWEMALAKYCYTYNALDAWEFEKFGYMKAKLSTKLQLLKNLLESQFETNSKFKTELNKIPAEGLRIDPLGRDIQGHSYWMQIDEEYNLRMYREVPEEENTWKLICKLIFFFVLFNFVKKIIFFPLINRGSRLKFLEELLVVLLHNIKAFSSLYPERLEILSQTFWIYGLVRVQMERDDISNLIQVLQNGDSVIKEEGSSTNISENGDSNLTAPKFEGKKEDIKDKIIQNSAEFTDTGEALIKNEDGNIISNVLKVKTEPLDDGKLITESKAVDCKKDEVVKAENVEPSANFDQSQDSDVRSDINEQKKTFDPKKIKLEDGSEISKVITKKDTESIGKGDSKIEPNKNINIEVFSQKSDKNQHTSEKQSLEKNHSPKYTNESTLLQSIEDKVIVEDKNSSTNIAKAPENDQNDTATDSMIKVNFKVDASRKFSKKNICDISNLDKTLSNDNCNSKVVQKSKNIQSKEATAINTPSDNLEVSHKESDNDEGENCQSIKVCENKDKLSDVKVSELTANTTPEISPSKTLTVRKLKAEFSEKFKREKLQKELPSDDSIDTQKSVPHSIDEMNRSEEVAENLKEKLCLNLQHSKENVKKELVSTIDSPEQPLRTDIKKDSDNLSQNSKSAEITGKSTYSQEKCNNKIMDGCNQKDNTAESSHIELERSDNVDKDSISKSCLGLMQVQKNDKNVVVEPQVEKNVTKIDNISESDIVSVKSQDFIHQSQNKEKKDKYSIGVGESLPSKEIYNKKIKDDFAVTDKHNAKSNFKPVILNKNDAHQKVSCDNKSTEYISEEVSQGSKKMLEGTGNNQNLNKEVVKMDTSESDEKLGVLEMKRGSSERSKDISGNKKDSAILNKAYNEDVNSKVEEITKVTRSKLSMSSKKAPKSDPEDNIKSISTRASRRNKSIPKGTEKTDVIMDNLMDLSSSKTQNEASSEDVLRKTRLRSTSKFEEEPGGEILTIQKCSEKNVKKFPSEKESSRAKKSTKSTKFKQGSQTFECSNVETEIKIGIECSTEVKKQTEEILSETNQEIKAPVKEKKRKSVKATEKLEPNSEDENIEVPTKRISRRLQAQRDRQIDEQREREKSRKDNDARKVQLELAARIKATAAVNNNDQDQQEEEIPPQPEKKKKKKKKVKKKGWNPWDGSSDSTISEESEEIEPEEEEEPEEELKFDENYDEFAPEDIDENEEPIVVKRARTLKKGKLFHHDILNSILLYCYAISSQMIFGMCIEKDSDHASDNDDVPCGRCGKSDHPEWILLCDDCDAGYHASCLQPPLMIIPVGNWFCPPCEHKKLCLRLVEELQKYDLLSKKREAIELRKQRLAYVGISLNNVLKPEDNVERKKTKVDSECSEDDDGSSSEDESSSDEDSGGNQVVYSKRTCRNREGINYRFKEYDELINSAIQEEIADDYCAGKGKDMANITNAEKEEEDDADGETKSSRKRKRPRLNDLDPTDDDDDDGSDDEYKGSNSDSASEMDLSDEAQTSGTESSDASWKIKQRRKSARFSRKSKKSKQSKKSKKRGYKHNDFVVDSDESNDSCSYPARRASTRKTVNYRESSEESEELQTSKWKSTTWKKYDRIKKRKNSSSESDNWKSKKEKQSNKSQKISDLDDEDSESTEESSAEDNDEGGDVDGGDDEEKEPSAIKTRAKKIDFKKIMESDNDESECEKTKKKLSKKIEDDDDEEESSELEGSSDYEESGQEESGGSNSKKTISSKGKRIIESDCESDKSGVKSLKNKSESKVKSLEGQKTEKEANPESQKDKSVIKPLEAANSDINSDMKSSAAGDCKVPKSEATIHHSEPDNMITSAPSKSNFETSSQSGVNLSSEYSQDPLGNYDSNFPEHPSPMKPVKVDMLTVHQSPSGTSTSTSPSRSSPSQFTVLGENQSISARETRYSPSGQPPYQGQYYSPGYQSESGPRHPLYNRNSSPSFNGPYQSGPPPNRPQYDPSSSPNYNYSGPSHQGYSPSGNEGSYQPDSPSQYPSQPYSYNESSGREQNNGGFMINNLLQRQNRNPEGGGEEDDLSGLTDIVSYITQE
ncbi:Remodeling and spacing factor 1 [Nymphon striatum]|nr:Remodeling and spacing factor 1 [Nymphon striatum]